MAKTDFKSVDEYLASMSRDSRPALQRVRRAILKALPGAEEVISYQIAAFKVDGRLVIYFAGWQEHYSLYPASDPLIAAFKDTLGPGEVRKRTLRFPLSEPVPADLIRRIAKFRAQEVMAQAKAKPAKRSSL